MFLLTTAIPGRLDAEPRKKVKGVKGERLKN
jgi:hypothetical protein